MKFNFYPKKYPSSFRNGTDRHTQKDPNPRDWKLTVQLCAGVCRELWALSVATSLTRSCRNGKTLASQVRPCTDPLPIPEKGRDHPSAALSVLFLHRQACQPWLQCAAGEPSPIHHKGTRFRQELGPSSAVLSSFRQGKAGWAAGSSQAKQTHRAPCALGSGAHQLCS